MNVIAAFILAQRNWQGKHCRRSRLRIQNKKDSRFPVSL
jgi:hypothetical protein